IFSRGKPLRKVATENLVDELFAEIDKYYASSKEIVVDESLAAEGAEWLAEIEAENAGDMTPERLAAMEKAAALDEETSPTAGRRFTRA
ncbi:MAG: (E)-4-hydroxy-3-methylbut-2-enyl-diphosphate synthase, partial [Solirubrobacteraceae bacterium]|nr:(E)-4-hydroxy-3-methylbut-2-enyl-diphosphate synthase [Solirubrobacteraceae bacterium]